MTSRQAAKNGGRLCGRDSQRRNLSSKELVHLYEDVQYSSLRTPRLVMRTQISRETGRSYQELQDRSDPPLIHFGA
jgi:hypothetical protein